MENLATLFAQSHEPSTVRPKFQRIRCKCLINNNNKLSLSIIDDSGAPPTTSIPRTRLRVIRYTRGARACTRRVQLYGGDDRSRTRRRCLPKRRPWRRAVGGGGQRRRRCQLWHNGFAAWSCRRFADLAVLLRCWRRVYAILCLLRGIINKCTTIIFII